MEISTPEMEKNMSFFLSANKYVVCHADISAKYSNDVGKLKLWKGSEKTKTCRDL